MEIKSVCVGELMVNCYILADGGEACVIDPGSEADKIVQISNNMGAKITKILLTHGHFDHIGAVKSLAEKTGAKVYVHKEDEIMLSDNEKNLNFMSEVKVEKCSADVLLNGGEVLKVGEKELKIYHTPGHSAGGISIYTDGSLFSGDLLFRGSIGRFDYGNVRVELESLKFLVDTFPKETVVYPGHGEFTTIGEEMQYNPYIIRHVAIEGLSEPASND